jgi:hypothetical protein
MSHPEPSGPDLDGVVADANAVALPYVVIDGFSVIANGFVRATKDSDLLVPDGEETDAAILRFLDRIDATRLRDDKILGKDEVIDANRADPGARRVGHPARQSRSLRLSRAGSPPTYADNLGL